MFIIIPLLSQKAGIRITKPDNYCVYTVHVVRSLNCQYQHMHNFNVTS